MGRSQSEPLSRESWKPATAYDDDNAEEALRAQCLTARDALRGCGEGGARYRAQELRERQKPFGRHKEQWRKKITN